MSSLRLSFRAGDVASFGAISGVGISFAFEGFRKTRKEVAGGENQMLTKQSFVISHAVCHCLQNLENLIGHHGVTSNVGDCRGSIGSTTQEHIQERLVNKFM